MDKDFLEQMKKKLQKEKETIEGELAKFADKDEKLKGDWDSKFPASNSGSFGSQILEEEADEVEEYVTRLPIEHSLELRLKDIGVALERIKKGKYGICERCGKEIDKERLEVYPAAFNCAKCGK